MKQRYSAKELADMKLDCLPTSKVGIADLAVREGWSYVDVTGRGGKRREYTPSAEVMGAIKAKVVNELLPAVVAPTVEHNMLPVAHTGADLGLSTHQANVEGARRVVLDAIDRINREAGVSREAAMTTMLTQARCGVLNPTLEAALRLSRDGRGSKNGVKNDPYPSIRTIKGWRKDQLEGNSLAPAGGLNALNIPAWASEFLKYYQRPQKPSVADAYDDLLDSDWAEAQLANGEKLPSIHQCRRFLDKMGNVSREVGRMGAREIKNIKGFRRRKFAHLMPNDIWTADGHTFDAEVAHPYHKRPFRPEITMILDVATRKAVGWSVDLAESGFAVLDAIRHGVVTNGLPAIFYVDNGSGYKNAMMSDRSVGLMGRLGVSIEHSIAYNSQARGVIEAFHKKLVKAAKKLPTYIGAPMDRQAMQLAHKVTRKAIKDASVKTPLMPFEAFVAYINQVCDDYNNRPHRALKGLTPNECWGQKVGDGFNAVVVNENETAYLFRPQTTRTVRRCEVSLFGNTYYAKELEEHHGDRVKVAYDIHDGEKVWVYNHKDVLICTAGFEANASDYMPKSAIEHAKDKRLAGREKRLNLKLDEVYAERGSNRLIEMGEAQTLEIPGVGRFDRAALAEAQPLRVVRNEPVRSVIDAPAAIEVEPVAVWRVPTVAQMRFDEFKRLTVQAEKGEMLNETQTRWIKTYALTSEYKVFAQGEKKAS